MATLIEDLQPAGLNVRLRLEDAPDLSAALQAAMPGWPLARRPVAGRIALRGRREGQAYRLWSAGESRSRRLTGVATVASCLVADLIPEVLATWPQAIGLHCAAVEVNGRLLVFPATHRAGKSLLCAAFAAAGYRVFADDVLLLTPEGAGMALGIAPRLRLPLPDTLSSRLAGYVAGRGGVGDDRYRYLDLGRESLASHGERCPLGSIILLERCGEAVPSLTQVSPGEGLLRLLGQSLAGTHHEPAELLPRLLPMMKRLPCRMLRFDDPMAAVARLVGAHACDDRPEIQAFGSDRSAVDWPDEMAWRRRPVTAEYVLGDERFLVDDRGDVHRLNPLANSIWRLLGLEPLSRLEIVALLRVRFPDISPARLDDDVGGLFDALAALGLVVPADD
ncbi:PqqD family protein [Halomonas organivorans]|uniref:PqqD family peptide modification chaperone n=1 Tax=Halomonas organivorans TaxID=257772 RepID=A0A7W5BWJ6_9GAMM|nr:PqqD family protein [Halomonas organivorans]MBB3139988.1 hypothetical protein [Halomonas organivorans]